MSDVTAVPIRPIKRSIVVWIVLGIVLALGAAIWFAVHGTASVVAEKGPPDQFLAANARQDGVIQTASGLQYKVLEPGQGGAKPTDSDITLVEYEGKLRDGSTFDKSERPTPMPVAAVVPGFSEALKLMTKGQKIRAWIKPELAYGAEPKSDPQGKEVIPANSVLIFDLTLRDFLPEAAVRQMQMQQQMMQQQGGAGGAPGGMPPGLPGMPGQ
ncbi:MAG: FKBP-type peptidyl-prolyl cis-trans isomerase [Pseudomonadota bacterium]